MAATGSPLKLNNGSGGGDSNTPTTHETDPAATDDKKRAEGEGGSEEEERVIAGGEGKLEGRIGGSTGGIEEEEGIGRERGGIKEGRLGQEGGGKRIKEDRELGQGGKRFIREGRTERGGGYGGKEVEEEVDVKTEFRTAEGKRDSRAGRLSLCRQLCLTAGLMSSDGGLVFLQLTMVPCLQSLGVPVALVTLPGVISGSLALLALPLMGWVSDGGANPQRRKKPAVVLSALIFVAGYSMVIAGCALRIQVANQHPLEAVISNSTGPESKVSCSSAADPSLIHPLLYLCPEQGKNNSNAANVELQAMGSWSSPSEYGDSKPVSSLERAEGSQKNGSNAFADVRNSLRSSEDSMKPESAGSSDGSSTNISIRSLNPEDDTVLTLSNSVAGLLGVLGFVFMDLGNDLSNSCLKGLILSCTARSQHSSVLVVGVLMSALGGCLAAVLGVLDLAALVLAGQQVDAVAAKTLLKAAFFLALTVVCVLVTLCSAPAVLPSTFDRGKTTAPEISQRPSDAGQTNNETDEPHVTVHDGQSALSPLMPSHTSVTNSVVVLCDDDGDCERTGIQSHARTSLSGSLDGTSLQTKTKSCKTLPVDSEYRWSLTENMKEAGEQFPLQPFDRAGSVSVHAGSDNSLHSCRVMENYDQAKFLVQYDHQQTADGNQKTDFLQYGKLRVKITTLKMVRVCVSMFFMAGAWQSFNICATYYLGKVVYGGDPDADRASQSYAAYSLGIRSGSLGVLMLNVAYVIINLLQKKIMALVGPKAEYMLVCVVQMGVLVCLQLTDRVEVFYTAAVVYGVFRCVMYTVPFILANSLCQQASRAKGKAATASVGSTMALMTAMMPLSYVLVSAVTSPLIHATRDPASPLYYAIAATALAAFVFAFT